MRGSAVKVGIHAVCGLMTITALSGCGKKGPMIYPDLLVPEAPKGVQVEQRGTSLQLAFSLPAKDMAGRRLKDPFVVQVQRRELDPSEAGDCGSCPKDYMSTFRVDPEFPDPAMKFGDRIVLLDSNVRTGKRYQYRLQAVRKEGDNGAPAESVRTMVCAAPAAPSVQAKSVHGGYIQLVMQGEEPENAELIGYSIYRSSGDEPLPYQPLASTLTEPRYEDQTVQRGITYRYAVRMFVRRGDDVVAVSELSAPVAIKVADDPN